MTSAAILRLITGLALACLLAGCMRSEPLERTESPVDLSQFAWMTPGVILSSGQERKLVVYEDETIVVLNLPEDDTAPITAGMVATLFAGFEDNAYVLEMAGSSSTQYAGIVMDHSTGGSTPELHVYYRMGRLDDIGTWDDMRARFQGMLDDSPVSTRYHTEVVDQAFVEAAVARFQGGTTATADAEDNTEQPQPEPVPEPEPQPLPVPALAQSPWTLTDRTDPFTDMVERQAYIHATEITNSEQATLFLVCRNGTARVHLDFGVPMVWFGEGARYVVTEARFDSNAPMRLAWDPIGDATQVMNFDSSSAALIQMALAFESIFLPEQRDLIVGWTPHQFMVQLLQSSDRFIVRATSQSRNPVTAHFDIDRTHSIPAINHIVEFCPLPAQ